MLNYDLADVRLPGAVADPATGSPRLAKPLSQGTMPKSKAYLPGTVNPNPRTTSAPRISGLDYGARLHSELDALAGDNPVSNEYGAVSLESVVIDTDFDNCSHRFSHSHDRCKTLLFELSCLFTEFCFFVVDAFTNFIVHSL